MAYQLQASDADLNETPSKPISVSSKPISAGGGHQLSADDAELPAEKWANQGPGAFSVEGAVNNLKNVAAGAGTLATTVLGHIIPTPTGVNALHNELVAHHLIQARAPGFFANLQKSIENAPGVNPHSASFQIGNLGASMAVPFGDAGLAEKALQPAIWKAGATISKMFPSIAGAGLKATEALSAAAPAATQGAVAGALTANQGQTGMGALTGAAVGPLVHGALNAPKIGMNAYFNNLESRANNYFAGAKSRAEVDALNQQLGNLPANFGTVVGKPGLSKAINFATLATPFSAAKNYAPILVGHADKAANDLLAQFSHGVDPAEATSTVADNVKSNYNDKVSASSRNYNAFLKAGASFGSKAVQYPQATALAPKIADTLFNPTSPMSGASKIYSHIKAFLPPAKVENAATPNMVTIAGKKVDISAWPESMKSQLLASGAIQKEDSPAPFVPPQTSFEDGHLSNGRMAEDIRTFQKKGQGTASNLLGKFKAAVGNDIENSGDKLNSNVGDLWRNANSFHESDVVPYQEQGIQKIIKGKSNLKEITTTLLNSKNKNIVSDFSPEQLNNLIYAHFLNNADSDSNGNPIVTANSMMRAHKSIPREVQNRIFTPEQQQSFNQLKAFNSVTPEAKLMLSPPFTGGRVALGAAKASLIGGLGTAAHYLGMSEPSAILAGLAARSAANKALKYAYSPGIREAYAAGGYKLNPNNLNTKTGKLALQLGLKARNFLNENDSH